MPAAPLPADEARRLASLARLGVLDTLPEQVYDDLVHLAGALCGTPVALLNLVAAERQWSKAHVGEAASELPRELSFCAQAILEPEQVFVVPDAARDPRFRDNPVTSGEDGVVAYAGAPVVLADGAAIGSLCVVDHVPRDFTEPQLEALRRLSRLAAELLEARAGLRQIEDRFLGEVRALQHERDQLQAEQAVLEAQSSTDPLTGLLNRRAFQARMDEEVVRAVRSGAPLAFVIADLDAFKSYNDTFGHPAGDAALRQAAQLLRASGRLPDVIARWGGEEFVALLPATSAEGAVVMAERFRRAVQQASWPHRPVTASFGVATLADGNGSAEAMIAAADAALYRAKRAGRNRVAVHGTDTV